MVQWLRLHASTAGGKDLIPGRGTKNLHATQPKTKQNKTNKQKYIWDYLLNATEKIFLTDKERDQMGTRDLRKLPYMY